MRARSVLPRPLWRLVRDGYWRRFWARELRLQQKQLGSEAAASLVGSERAVLAEAIGDSYPFDSLLEVGCSYGQLFHVIGAQYPKARLVGVDPDRARLSAGEPILREHGLGHVELRFGMAEDLSQFADNSFDLVVTSASLLYVSPDAIERALSELLRVSRRRVLLLEQQIDEPETPLGRLGPARIKEEPYWLRDYRRLFERQVPPERIRLTRVPNPLWRTESWGATAHLIAVEVG